MIRDGIEIAKFATHPATVAGVGVFALAGACGFGWIDEAGPKVSVHEKATVTQERVKGLVTEIDLDVQPITLLGFTTEIRDPDKASNPLAPVDQGTQVTLDKTLVVENDLFIPFKREISLSNQTLTWNGTVKTRVLLDLKDLDIQFDPGYDDDPTDDSLIVTLPLSAISTEAEVDPMNQESDLAGDSRDWPANLVTALTQSITQLKKVPGLSQLAVATNKKKEFMEGLAQIGAMHDVQKACSPKVIQEQDVYSVIKDRIDTATGSALREAADKGTLDPGVVKALGSMTGMDALSIPVTVYIGNEDASNPNNLGQLKEFPAEYDDLIGELKDEASMVIGDNYTGDGLQCNLSKEVRDQIAHNSTSQQGETLRRRTEG